MRKSSLSQFLRKYRLLQFADRINFYKELYTNRKVNNSFIKNNPNVKLPPDYLMYESFQLNYNKYYTESINAAKWLIDHLLKHIELKNKMILDWGCGPARIVRHLPDMLNECEIYGSDYNGKSIKWCKKNIKNVSFYKNEVYQNKRRFY